MQPTKNTTHKLTYQLLAQYTKTRLELTKIWFVYASFLEVLENLVQVILFEFVK